MRNGDPDARREKGGSTITALFKPLNMTRARRSSVDTAHVALTVSGTIRRLTPEHAERLARELLDAATAAREFQIARSRPPEPPTASAAALPAA